MFPGVPCGTDQLCLRLGPRRRRVCVRGAMGGQWGGEHGDVADTTMGSEVNLKSQIVHPNQGCQRPARVRVCLCAPNIPGHLRQNALVVHARSVVVTKHGELARQPKLVASRAQAHQRHVGAPRSAVDFFAAASVECSRRRIIKFHCVITHCTPLSPTTPDGLYSLFFATFRNASTAYLPPPCFGAGEAPR